MYIMQERRETSGTFETDRTLWANAVSMLGQRWRLCTNIETALGECPVFAGKSFYWTLGTRYSQEEGDDGWGKDNSWADFADGSNSVLMSKTNHNIKTIYIDPMFVYCWASVIDIGPTLNQPCVNPVNVSPISNMDKFPNQIWPTKMIFARALRAVNRVSETILQLDNIPANTRLTQMSINCCFTMFTSSILVIWNIYGNPAPNTQRTQTDKYDITIPVKTHPDLGVGCFMLKHLSPAGTRLLLLLLFYCIFNAP